MAVTEVTSQSWFSRLGSAFTGIVVGLVFFAAAFPLLFWNEGRAVRTAKSLAEGAGSVVSVAAAPIDPANEGRLVHMSGEAVTGETLADPAFGIEARAIALSRSVEMYQWQEKQQKTERNKLGGGTETVTTYSYEKVWDESPIASSGFKEAGHDNPGDLPYASERWVADRVTLGAFTLSAGQIAQIGGAAKLPVRDAHLDALPEDVRERASVRDGELYLGDTATPAIGDVKVRFEVIDPHAISIVGVQHGETFAPYQAAAGDAILMVSDGTETAAGMFKAADDANTMATWILRAAGFALMFFGLLMIFKPISVFGSVIPFVGSLLGAGLGAVAFMLSVCLASLTIAVAWIFYRPLLGIALVAIAGAAFAYLVMRGRKAPAAVVQPAVQV
jgi:hypothetical protein